MANFSPTAHWRDSARSPRFFILDARAVFFVLFFKKKREKLKGTGPDGRRYGARKAGGDFPDLSHNKSVGNQGARGAGRWSASVL